MFCLWFNNFNNSGVVYLFYVLFCWIKIAPHVSTFVFVDCARPVVCVVVLFYFNVKVGSFSPACTLSLSSRNSHPMAT